MPLTVKELSDPLRPTPKGGDVKKCGDVDRSTQKVGTSYGFRKRRGRRPNVGTSPEPENVGTSPGFRRRPHIFGCYCQRYVCDEGTPEHSVRSDGLCPLTPI